MSRSFVAGATGYTGRAVVQLLRERGEDVVAHVRPDSPRLAEHEAWLTSAGAMMDATPWEPAALERRLKELSPDLVFALLGTTKARVNASKRVGVQESYDSVDYGLTAMLLQAALACDPRPRFVYLSAAGVSESARGAYYRARSRAEQEITRSGVAFIIARPSFISGDRSEARPGETVGAAVADAALGLASVFGARRLARRYQSMNARQLAQGLVDAALAQGPDEVILEAEDLRGDGPHETTGPA